MAAEGRQARSSIREETRHGEATQLSWHLQVLGPANVRKLEQPPIYLERKAAALLAYLALEGATTRSRLAGLLWPDVDESNARNNLRQLLHRLRGLEGLLEPGDPLDLGQHIHIDAALLKKAATQGAVANVMIDVSRPPGELLAGMDYADTEDLNDWVLIQREQLRQIYASVLEAEVDRFEGAGELAAALAMSRVLLESEPASEAAHRRLIRLHYLNGDRPAALQAYRYCKEVLKRQLGIEPLPETVALAADIEKGIVVPDVPVPASQPIPLALLRPPLLAGREREWALMHEAWQTGKVIYIGGEPGVGKTRLATDFAEKMGPYFLHQGRPGDYSIPWGHFARALRALLSHESGPHTEDWVRRELARIVPELHPHPPGPMASHEEKMRFFEAFDIFMRRLALAQGIATVVVDDHHRFHPAGIEYGDYLISKTSPAEPLIGGLRWIHTFRPSEMNADSRRQMMELLHAGMAIRITLLPLPEPAISELLAGLLLPWVDGLAGELRRLTGGNPLFIVETLKSLFESGEWGGDHPTDIAVPKRVETLILQRLERLSPAAIRLSQVMALAGPEFTPELAANVLETSILSIGEAVEELQQAQIANQNQFTHDLLMETVLATIPAVVRPMFHRLIAESLEDVHAEAGRIARHWVESGDHTRAVPWLLLAAETALVRGVPDRALAFLSEASEIADLKDHQLAQTIALLQTTLVNYDSQPARDLLDTLSGSQNPGTRSIARPE